MGYDLLEGLHQVEPLEVGTPLDARYPLLMLNAENLRGDTRLEGGPPEELPDESLHGAGVHRQREQQRHSDGCPVVVVDPPGPDAASIQLNTNPQPLREGTHHKTPIIMKV